MALWILWWSQVSQLRPAFSRSRTFFWFAAALAASCVRHDLLGVSSLVRALIDRRLLFRSSLPVGEFTTNMHIKSRKTGRAEENGWSFGGRGREKEQRRARFCLSTGEERGQSVSGMLHEGVEGQTSPPWSPRGDREKYWPSEWIPGSVIAEGGGRKEINPDRPDPGRRENTSGRRPKVNDPPPSVLPGGRERSFGEEDGEAFPRFPDV